MSELIKNIDPGIVFDLAAKVAVEPGRINSLTLSQTPGCKMTLLAIDAGEGMASHAAGGDALVCALEGEVEIVLSGEPVRVRAGEALLMPKGAPHSVTALTPFKMLLVVVL